VARGDRVEIFTGEHSAEREHERERGRGGCLERAEISKQPVKDGCVGDVLVLGASQD
jgi:hypothetical protein